MDVSQFINPDALINILSGAIGGSLRGPLFLIVLLTVLARLVEWWRFGSRTDSDTQIQKLVDQQMLRESARRESRRRLEELDAAGLGASADLSKAWDEYESRAAERAAAGRMRSEADWQSERAALRAEHFRMLTDDSFSVDDLNAFRSQTDFSRLDYYSPGSPRV